MGERTKQIVVRRVEAADAPTLAELRWRWRTDERGEASGDRTAFLADFTAWVRDHLATHLPFVVEVDGEAVGMAWLMLADRVPSPALPDRRTGDIQAVYVVPEERDRGVGGALLSALLDEARARGLEHVTVHSSERAVPFYLRHGFVREERWLEWKP